MAERGVVDASRSSVGRDPARPRMIALAASLVVLQLALIVVQVVLSELGRAYPPFSASSVALDLEGGLTEMLFPALGLLVVARRPGNPMGWLFVLAYLGWTANNAGAAYAEYATAVAPLPGVPLAVWLTTWPGSASIVILVLLIVLFPDGRAPSPRWRRFAEFAVGWGIASSLLAAFAPGPTQAFQVEGLSIDNPVGLSGPLGQVVEVIANPAPLVSVALVVLATISVVGRLRRSAGLERQQLKWLAYSVVLAAVLWAADVPVMVAFSSLRDAPAWARLVNTVSTGSGGLIPLGAAIAILRYRLYDIDRIISRTVSYAALTAVLATVYVAGSLGLEAALVPLTKGGGVIAVAASTLAVFALFQPVRRRIQAVVDRRFNRSRYDAEREIDRFAAHVRDEVEVERVADALAATLARTMQPASAAVWLRSEGQR